MLFRLLATGLIAGAAAGVIATLFHFVLVEPLIFAAEQYEDRAPQAAAAPRAPAQTGQDTGAPVHIHRDGQAHTHDAWQPADGLQRSGLTLVANIITGIAFGLLLAMAFTLYGNPVTLFQGLVWGAAGFLCFAFLPALGLPPEVPGAAAGNLLDRQIWWLATAFVSAAGLAALVFIVGWPYRGAGVLLLFAPHIVGAPRPDPGSVGSAPPELAAHFAVNSLFAAAVMWLALGVAAAYVMQRIAARQDTGIGADNAIS
ncbi:MAG: hypothetical protein CMM10_07290 [Rhodospirillaceae bacterium]|jgi:cobalt transporter subunit CbtA|nr:hypothetical protein [Rhodospirillaceae bacterium]MDP6645618.1 CbtA family protein [Rhodospirillales bacterium]|tara:strand:+ start:62 stop:832 length:771 start_codon:yes stop_codon:yes gene_type:complete